MSTTIQPLENFSQALITDNKIFSEYKKFLDEYMSIPRNLAKPMYYATYNGQLIDTGKATYKKRGDLVNKLAHSLTNSLASYYRHYHTGLSQELSQALSELNLYVIGSRARKQQQNIQKEFVEMLIEKGIIEIKQTI